MAVGGGGEGGGADDGVAIAEEAENDRATWARYDVAVLWDRRDRVRRCFIAISLSVSLSLSTRV